METKSNTLMDTAKIYWQYFILAWFFPILFYFSELIAERIGQPFNIFFTHIDLPIFFIAFIVSALPWFQGKIQYKHYTFWGIAFPFIIWSSIVLIGVSVKLNSHNPTRAYSGFHR
jgi:hypothetical protein